MISSLKPTVLWTSIHLSILSYLSIYRSILGEGFTLQLDRKWLNLFCLVVHSVKRQIKALTPGLNLFIFFFYFVKVDHRHKLTSQTEEFSRPASYSAISSTRSFCEAQNCAWMTRMNKQTKSVLTRLFLCLMSLYNCLRSFVNIVVWRQQIRV